MGRLAENLKVPELKLLVLDIETTPNLAYVWGLWDQNVGLNQIAESTEMLCWAAKWVGKRGVSFRSKNDPDMVEEIHRLLSEADCVIHYNGQRFDVPHLNREFLLAGLPPPAPFEQIDLWNTIKRRFKFPSTKLEYVSRALGLSGKVKHEGFELWTGCMEGDPKAWAMMERYNKQDVVLTEELYGVVKPWITKHPTRTLYQGGSHCPICGGKNMVKDGYAYTSVSKYQRWRCEDCGGWFRSGARVGSVSVRQTPL